MLQNTQKITLFNLYEIHINDTNTRPRNYKNKIVDQHSLWWHMQTSLTICYQSSMIIVVVFIQSLSCVQLCDPMDCSMLGFPVLHHLLELTQTHVHWVNDAIQPPHLCHSLLLLPSVFPSMRTFSNESALCIKVPKGLEHLRS